MKKLPIKWFAVFSLSLLVVSCTGCSTIRKAYWDHKVKELCLKEAGVTVYERVGMSKEEYDNLKIKPIKYSDSSQKYFNTFDTEYLYKTSGDVGIKVMKFTGSIVRKIDQKVLGDHVAFGRSGGDSIFFSWMQPSHYDCSSLKKEPDLRAAIFYIEE